MDKKIILGILVIAAFVFVASRPGSFFADAPDPFYSHLLTAPTSVAYGQTIPMTIGLSEINRGLVSCDENGMGGRISPSTENYCKSITYLNARSVKVVVDGQEQVNWGAYPVGKSGASLTTQLNDAGVVDIDGNNYPAASLRPYHFSKLVPAQTSLNGQNLFTLNIPQYLAPGAHTIDVYYFSDTVTHTRDDASSPLNWGRVVGTDEGDNLKTDYHQTFSINVTAGTISCGGMTEGTKCVVARTAEGCAVGAFENPQECSYYINSADVPAGGTGSGGDGTPPYPDLSGLVRQLQSSLANAQSAMMVLLVVVVGMAVYVFVIRRRR